MSLLVLNGSPSPGGRTRALAEAFVVAAGHGRIVDLAALDAEALLGRRRSGDLDEVLDAVRATARLVVVTPTYRATYTGLLKLVFDQLAEGDLAGTAVVAAATGASAAHRLPVDAALRALAASVGGWVVPTGVYATPEGVVGDVERAIAEADLVARGIPLAGRARVPV